MYLCYTLYTITTVLFMCVCTVLWYYLQFGDKITNQHRVLLPRRPISCTYMYCDCASGRGPILDCTCPLYVFVAPCTKSPIYKRDLHTAHCMSLCPQVWQWGEPSSCQESGTAHSESGFCRVSQSGTSSLGPWPISRSYIFHSNSIWWR